MRRSARPFETGKHGRKTGGRPGALVLMEPLRVLLTMSRHLVRTAPLALTPSLQLDTKMRNIPLAPELKEGLCKCSTCWCAYRIDAWRVA